MEANTSCFRHYNAQSIIILPRTHKQPRILSDPQYFFKRSLIRGRELQRLESFVNIFKGVDCEATVERRASEGGIPHYLKFLSFLKCFSSRDRTKMWRTGVSILKANGSDEVGCRKPPHLCS